MGYTYGYGPTLYADMIEGTLRVYTQLDTVVEYYTGLKATLSKQLNRFKAADVSWVLFNDDDTKMYLGRVDGTVSVFEYPSMLVYAATTWDSHGRPPVGFVGTYVSDKNVPSEVYVNKLDRRTCYIKLNQERCYILDVPIDFTANISAACSAVVLNKQGIHIFRGSEEVSNEGHWYIQDDAELRDILRFL